MQPYAHVAEAVSFENALGFCRADAEQPATVTSQPLHPDAGTDLYRSDAGERPRTCWLRNL
jgi:hypothetical protein